MHRCHQTDRFMAEGRAGAIQRQCDQRTGLFAAREQVACRNAGIVECDICGTAGVVKLQAVTRDTGRISRHQKQRQFAILHGRHQQVRGQASPDHDRLRTI